MTIDGWKKIEARRRREEHQQKLEAYVKKMADEWPPLTDEQLNRIAALLRAGRRTAGDT